MNCRAADGSVTNLGAAVLIRVPERTARYVRVKYAGILRRERYRAVMGQFARLISGSAVRR